MCFIVLLLSVVKWRLTNFHWLIDWLIETVTIKQITNCSVADWRSWPPIPLCKRTIFAVIRKCGAYCCQFKNRPNTTRALKQRNPNVIQNQFSLVRTPAKIHQNSTIFWFILLTDKQTPAKAVVTISIRPPRDVHSTPYVTNARLPVCAGCGAAAYINRSAWLRLANYVIVHLMTFDKQSVVRVERASNNRISVESKSTVVAVFFVNRVLDVWNGLPVDIVEKFTSVTAFKRTIKLVDFTEFLKCIWTVFSD